MLLIIVIIRCFRTRDFGVDALYKFTFYITFCIRANVIYFLLIVHKKQQNVYFPIYLLLV